ncbi:hypothetical protein ROHU_022655 [Labeo rohita]|uniref:Uncharacterized protein n=1 Tax=Labeo rohita TaxID=84645 RepID=A0A498MZG8_LABRO|nr:hypothetical protein ROHU_022655 [Labeo rohita]
MGVLQLYRLSNVLNPNKNAFKHTPLQTVTTQDVCGLTFIAMTLNLDKFIKNNLKAFTDIIDELYSLSSLIKPHLDLRFKHSTTEN